jgi:hypothetical protein
VSEVEGQTSLDLDEVKEKVNGLDERVANEEEEPEDELELAVYEPEDICTFY